MSVATLIANLEARRDTIGAQLAAMTSSSVGGKANSNQPGAADHVEYKDGLYRELKEINEQLIQLDDELNGGGDGGAEIISYGF
jgi:hypothetical protein